MKKLIDSRRWLAFGLFAVIGTAALFYTNPPTPGRAFSKKATYSVETQLNDSKRTPDDLLW